MKAQVCRVSSGVSRVHAWISRHFSQVRCWCFFFCQFKFQFFKTKLDWRFVAFAKKQAPYNKIQKGLTFSWRYRWPWWAYRWPSWNRDSKFRSNLASWEKHNISQTTQLRTKETMADAKNSLQLWNHRRTILLLKRWNRKNPSVLE